MALSSARAASSSKTIARGGPVENAILGNDRGPARPNLREARSAGRDGESRHFICVDDERAEAGENSRDLTLPRADAAGQPDARYSTTLSRAPVTEPTSPSTAKASISSGETSATCWIEPVMRRVP